MLHRFAISCLLVSCILSSAAAARAGTTGGLSGIVYVAGTTTPLAGVRITATSPSETTSTRTDAGGHFSFVSLVPDTYTVSADKESYDPVALAGVSILADATQTLTVSLHKSLREIGRVTARTSSDLVKPGTTSDVYSVNAAQQARVSALGGGGALNSAYSAIASVPGAYVPPNQSGYLQTVHIRGGDSDQVGYEFDGIPVNRAFDNYPSGSASSLGQLELQVYTGASPASAEGQGLAGFINQVIRTGTYPGYSDADFAIGGPSYYHSLNVEVGGSTPSRTFSYYVGIGGYNQDYRYIDQFSGAAYANTFGPIINNCPGGSSSSGPPPPLPLPPSCLTNGHPNTGIGGQPGYVLGPINFGNLNSTVATRTSVVNLHFGIPHHHDGGRDDIQVLYDNDEIFSTIFSSANDAIQQNLIGSGLGLPTYLDTWQYTGKLGAFLPANPTGLVVPYLFPSSPQPRSLNAPIPVDQRDTGYNAQAIVKLQYQRNFSPSAYLRVYGYTYYSNYIGTGANSSWQPYTGFDSGDYELSAHTRGVSATFADQLSSKHLLNAQASYTTSNALRMYNTQMFNFPGFPADSFAVLVNPHDLNRGICYGIVGGSSSSSSLGRSTVPTSCNDGSLAVSNSATFASLAAIGTGQGIPNVSGLTCGGAPCAFYVVENGQIGEYNLVRPNFYGLALTDQWKPNDRLLVNAGLRLDQYGYTGDDTTNSPARAFWFNAWNNDTCFNTQTLTLYDKTSLVGGKQIPLTAACSTAGSQYTPATLTNTPNQTFIYNVLQPRIGATYTLNPDAVLRASYGKYIEQPSSAYEQYDALQQNLPDLLGPEFYSYGFTTPGHEVRPAISYNADFSWEQHIHGTDMSFKLTPFYRKTQDQIENFYLNVKAGLISGLNVGRQTSAGFELQFNKGDFDRNGFAGQLSFAYTNAYVNYDTLPNGSTIVSSVNGDIRQYNAYTSFCASNPKDGRCGGVLPTNGLPASPCYLAAISSSSSSSSFTGVPVACTTAGAVANPYWKAPPQPLLDPNANYLPYTTFPAAIGAGANSFIVPYVATLILNYKHDRWAVTPSFQFAAGNRYGAPETMPGVDPAAGCLPLTGHSVAGDPRYPYGAAGGLPYNATSCAFTGLAAIPDSFTGQFDPLGAFRQPSQFLMHLRLSYDVTPKVTLVATIANLVNTCFGSQNTPFTYYWSGSVCSFSTLASGISPVGNIYNPGANIQPFLKYPYEPSFGSYNDNSDSTRQPLTIYVSAKIKM